jgi:hypothetical protein
MPSKFNRAEVLANTTRTALYGPVAVGTTAIVFGGTFANIDSTNKIQHTLTLEIKNAANAYVTRLPAIPIEYGGASKCPKTVLLPGEYLYVSSDTNGVIQSVVDILERT